MTNVPDSKDYYKQTELPPPPPPKVNIVPSPTGSQVVDGALTSPNFVKDRSGWRLSSDGSVELGDTTIVGRLKLDSLYFTKQFVFTFFESQDGWTKTAGITSAIGGTAMQTSATINTTRSMSAEVFGTANKVAWDTKNPKFMAGVIFDHDTAQTIYFGMGEMTAGSPVDGVGFKNVDGSVYAMTAIAGTETTVLLSGILADEWHIYEADFISATATAQFYVDNALVATINTNVPTGTSPVLMDFNIKNTEASNKAMYLTFASFQQDR